MAKKKTSLKYYFSVEGETEKWYLEWLRDSINNNPKTIRKIACTPTVQKSPLKWAKAHSNLYHGAKVFHVFDFEDEGKIHANAFKAILKSMKDATELDRGFKYNNAYSNLTFELWIILHRGNCQMQTHRDQYLKPINDLYDENFKSLHEYKQEANFKRILNKLTINDVIEAVKRAEILSQKAEENDFRKREYCGYTYYLDNPTTDLWIPIKDMLSTSGLLKK